MKSNLSPGINRFHINDRENLVCLLVDLQDGLIAAMQQDVRNKTEANINLIITSAKIMHIPIIITEQYPKGLGHTVKPVRENLGELYEPIEKMCFSCWDQPAFQEKVKLLTPKSVIITGIEAHICVLQTALDLLSHGYNVRVVSDAICSRYKSDWTAAVRLMEQAGAVITTTETLIFQLLKRAGTREFKLISPLFKQRS